MSACLFYSSSVSHTKCCCNFELKNILELFLESLRDQLNKAIRRGGRLKGQF